MSELKVKIETIEKKESVTNCRCGNKLEFEDFLELVTLGYPPIEAAEEVNKINYKDHIMRDCCKITYSQLLQDELKK